jgi:hypothetical protein
MQRLQTIYLWHIGAKREQLFETTYRVQRLCEFSH